MTMSNTSDEEFAASERTDRLFDRVLGCTLEQAMVRLAVLGTVGGLLISLAATAVT